MEPRVGPFSTMKLSRPVRMVDTDQAGFHVSGWKSVMERHSLQKNETVRLGTRCCKLTQILEKNKKRSMNDSHTE